MRKMICVCPISFIGPNLSIHGSEPYPSFPPLIFFPPCFTARPLHASVRLVFWRLAHDGSRLACSQIYLYFAFCH